jgi:GNAT superfamily N-acetyltransferase
MENARGEIVGGIYGDAFVGCMEVDRFWIAEDYRGRGLGTKLMEMMQSEARKIGCTIMYLSTFGFQAPLFYEKLGFERFGSLELKDGAEKILYRKPLLAPQK